MWMLSQVKYHWMILAVTLSCWLYFLKDANMWGLLFVLLTIMRVLACQRKAVTGLAIILGVLVFCSNLSQEQAWDSQERAFQEGEKITFLLETDPNKLTYQSDAFFGEGIVKLNGKEVAVQFTYWSKTSQNYSRILTNQVVHIRGQGKMKRIVGHRNFDVFDLRQYMKGKGIAWQLIIKDMDAVQPATSNFTNALTLLSKKLRVHFLRPFRQYEKIGLVGLHNKLLYNLDSPAYSNAKKDLAILGILHFFSISGFHLSFLREKLTYVLLRVGITPKVTRSIAAVCLLFFAWLVAWPIGVVRAYSYYYLNRLARHFSWPVSSIDSLAIIYLIMLIINPGYLTNLAFLLSFGMTCLVIFYQQEVRQRDLKLKDWQHQFYLTLFCLLFSWPLLLPTSYTINLLQIGVLLVISPFFDRWVMPGILGLSALIIAGQWYPSLIYWLQMLSLISQQVWQMMGLSRWVAGSEIILGNVGVGWIMLFMILAIFWFYWLFDKGKKAWNSLILGYCFLLIVLPYADPRDRVILLDVDQGDALLIKRSWTRNAWLIDTGGKTKGVDSQGEIDHKFADQTLIASLKSQGIDRLSGVIITHPDTDHLGSLERLIEVMPIDHLYLSEATQESVLWQRIQSNISSNTQQHIIPIGENRVIAEEKMVIFSNKLSPSEQDDSNAACLVVYFQVQDKAFLNMADLPISQIDSLLTQLGDHPVDILKLGHHGSRDATNDKLLDKLQPQLILNSSGRHNRYQHPHKEVLDLIEKRRIQLIDTQTGGAIELAHHPLWGWKLRQAETSMD